MTTERVERSDPARTLALLWGTQPQPTRGPRPTLTVEQIVDAAIEIADTEGLAAVSMRRVADALGFTTMSLYRYVPSKDDLLELMADRAAAPSPVPDGLDGWRGALRWWAEDAMAMYRARPWLVEVPLNAPPMGPNEIARMELALRALAGTQLTGSDKLGVLLMLSGYVRGHAQLSATLAQAETRTGVPEHEWDQVYGQMLKEHVTASAYPALADLVASGLFETFDPHSPHDDWPDTNFAFGLDRILDGIQVLIATM